MLGYYSAIVSRLSFCRSTFLSPEGSVASTQSYVHMLGVAGILELSHTSRPPCVFSSRWAFSIKLSVESAVTSTSSLHHIQHLCKHRATAAKHRCWQTVNTPWEQCASFKAELNCLLVLSPPQPQRNHVGLQMEKKKKKMGSIILHFQSRKMEIGKECLQLWELVFVLDALAMKSFVQPTVLSFSTFLPSLYTWRQMSQASWLLLRLGSDVIHKQAEAGGAYENPQKHTTDLKMNSSYAIRCSLHWFYRIRSNGIFSFQSSSLDWKYQSNCKCNLMSYFTQLFHSENASSLGNTWLSTSKKSTQTPAISFIMKHCTAFCC